MPSPGVLEPVTTPVQGEGHKLCNAYSSQGENACGPPWCRTHDRTIEPRGAHPLLNTVNGLLRNVTTDSLAGWLNATMMNAGTGTNGLPLLRLGLSSGAL